MFPDKWKKVQKFYQQLSNAKKCQNSKYKKTRKGFEFSKKINPP